VPSKEKDLHKMMIKGYDYGLDWDKVHDSAFSQISNPYEPSIKHSYQDDKKIEQNNEDMSRLRAREDAVAHLRRTTDDLSSAKRNNKATEVESNIYVGLEKPTEQFIAKVFDKAMDKFSKEDLRNDTSNLYNFIKDNLGLTQKSSYPVLHKLTVACMRQIMEHGHEYQMKNIARQQKGEELVR